MSVKLTQEAENDRVANAQRLRAAQTWEYLRTTSLVEAVHFARDNGWKNKKVQVKAYPINDMEIEFFVEPYEKNCHCPNLLKYSDYFD